MLKELVRPWDEVLPVRTVGVPAVVLPPRQLSVQHAHVDPRHLLRLVVVRSSQILRTEQAEHWPGCNGSHEAALVIQPLRVPLFRDAVADERRVGRAVLQEVPGHPVILTGAGEALDSLTPVPAMQLRASFSRRSTRT